jgi:hypothetical protein
MQCSKLRVAVLGAVIAALAVGLVQAASLRATVHHEVVSTYTGSNDLGSPSFALTAGAQQAVTLANGTGSGQANALFADQRTLSASATEQLDLYGSLTDPLGGTLNFATIKVIKVCAASANTNNVNVGGAASNTFTGPFSAASAKVGVRPGGCTMFVAPQTGWTVTDSSGDKLEFGNSSSGTTVTYDIVIVGTQ